MAESIEHRLLVWCHQDQGDDYHHEEVYEAYLKLDKQGRALDRADRLINWMAGYIGDMAPGKYAECYADLNAHGLFMNNRANEEDS